MGRFAKSIKHRKIAVNTMAKYKPEEIDAVVQQAKERRSLEEMLRQATDEMKKNLTARQAAIELDAAQRFATVMLSVLHDKNGFGHDRLKRLILETARMATDIRATGTKLEEVREMLQEETKIDIYQDNVVSLLFGAKAIVVEDDCKIVWHEEDK